MKDLLNKLHFDKKEILKEYKMKRLIRYNTRNRLTDEDIAQHSFFVCLFCLKIFKEIDLPIEYKYNILVKAILHDVCEIETGDFSYKLKKNYPQIKNILNNIEKDFYEREWKEYKDIIFTDNKIINSIIKLADIYSVKQYIMNEKILGNLDKDISEIYSEVDERINEQINILQEELS